MKALLAPLGAALVAAGLAVAPVMAGEDQPASTERREIAPAPAPQPVSEPLRECYSQPGARQPAFALRCPTL